MAKWFRVAASAAIVGLAGLGAQSAFGAGAGVASTHFSLFPSAATVACLAKSPSTAPTASATVVRGAQNDTVTLKLAGFKPHLGFDLFTVQRSNQTASGGPVANFANFGMAWYQSDVSTDASGNATVTVKTILLDQIFGFDPAVTLAPTNTFNLGFWFDSPAAAAPCGFAGPPTPFNGEHNAGPVAFITRPNATTGLGPLCTAPVKKAGVFSCNG